MQQHAVCPSPRPPVNLEEVLSEEEVLQLMRAFTRGKTTVLEDECLVLLQWAQAQRLRGLLLDWVLDGSIQPHIVEGEVRLRAAPWAGAERPGRE